MADVSEQRGASVLSVTCPSPRLLSVLVGCFNLTCLQLDTPPCRRPRADADPHQRVDWGPGRPRSAGPDPVSGRNATEHTRLLCVLFVLGTAGRYTHSACRQLLSSSAAALQIMLVLQIS